MCGSLKLEKSEILVPGNLIATIDPYTYIGRVSCWTGLRVLGSGRGEGFALNSLLDAGVSYCLTEKVQAVKHADLGWLNIWNSRLWGVVTPHDELYLLSLRKFPVREAERMPVWKEVELELIIPEARE